MIARSRRKRAEFKLAIMWRIFTRLYNGLLQNMVLGNCHSWFKCMMAVMHCKNYRYIESVNLSHSEIMPRQYSVFSWENHFIKSVLPNESNIILNVRKLIAHSSLAYVLVLTQSKIGSLLTIWRTVHENSSPCFESRISENNQNDSQTENITIDRRDPNTFSHCNSRHIPIISIPCSWKNRIEMPTNSVL